MPEQLTSIVWTVKLGINAGIRVVEEVERVEAEHAGGGWFGAEDGNTFARGFRQDAKVVLERFTSRFNVAVGERRHAAAPLARRHVDFHAVVMEHGDDGLGDGRIVVVREDVDEISDAGPAKTWWV